jgi:hypothetical protein
LAAASSYGQDEAVVEEDNIPWAVAGNTPVEVAGTDNDDDDVDGVVAAAEDNTDNIQEGVVGRAGGSPEEAEAGIVAVAMTRRLIADLHHHCRCRHLHH